MAPERIFLAGGSILALIAVAAGAFAAHGLKARIGVEALATFELAARYQMYHALALAICAFAWTRWPGPAVALAALLFCVGILLFCGSLYVLSLTGVKWLGAVTPLGGTAWLIGWGALAWAAVRY
jgi:uncharacterized membrane protein YgdD (TMEM256/DUF423 family)